VRVRELHEGALRLTGPEAHHLARVLRVRPGDPVVAFDGAGQEADGTVTAVDDQAVEVALGPVRTTSVEAPIEVEAAVALLKGDKLAQVVRQLTELGVSRVRPIVTARCDVPRLSPAKADRLRRVAAEAAKQAGRARVPPIDEPVPLARLAWSGPAWIADPRAERGWHALEATPPAPGVPVTLLTGPEGGFDPAEVAAAQERGAVAVRLGARTLRAETAPIALAAALLSRLEEGDG
jgi:16S rRNA (uracil1498-N3)-methyltransferase